MSLGDLPAGWSEGLQGLWLRCMALLSAGTPEAVRRAHGNSLTVISGACDHCWVTFGVAYSKQGAHAGACWTAGLGRVPASRPPSRSGASSHRHAAAAQTMCHCHLPGLTCRDERDEQHAVVRIKALCVSRKGPAQTGQQVHTCAHLSTDAGRYGLQLRCL